ncbi:MAG: IS110 family RNA-guided transposase [Candidatus Limnocylindrales bacterium]
MVYIGVDLHRKVSQLAVLDETGATLASHRIPSQRGEFLRVFGELEPGPIEVAFEATYGWGWFADLLADAGVAAHMAHPLATKAIGAGRVKNDAIDAATLAHLLRTSLLPEAWIAPPEVREARRLVRMRVALVRIRSRLKAQVHAVCADAGVGVPGSDLFGRAGRTMLGDLALPEVTGRRLAAHLRLIDTLGAEIADADREISRMFRHDPRVERLLPIPGVGLLTAATVVAEVWDVGRFPSADRLCSWAGLTPTERSSADHTRRGHISKQGSRWLRWIMVEAVSHLADPGLRAFAAPIEARRGRKIARIALARRMLTLCYYALRDSRGCRAYPVLRPTSPAVTARSPYGMASA